MWYGHDGAATGGNEREAWKGAFIILTSPRGGSLYTTEPRGEPRVLGKREKTGVRGKSETLLGCPWERQGRVRIIIGGSGL